MRVSSQIVHVGLRRVYGRENFLRWCVRRVWYDGGVTHERVMAEGELEIGNTYVSSPAIVAAALRLAADQIESPDPTEG